MMREHFTRLGDPGETDCVFCRILRREIPSRIIAERAQAVSFLDASPIVRGHCLVIQRHHAVDIIDSDSSDLAAAIGLVKEVVEATASVLKARGCSVWQTNGESARQTVPHTHFHVLPRYSQSRDDQTFPAPDPNANRDIDGVYEALRRSLMIAND